MYFFFEHFEYVIPFPSDIHCFHWEISHQSHWGSWKWRIIFLLLFSRFFYCLWLSSFLLCFFVFIWLSIWWSTWICRLVLFNKFGEFSAIVSFSFSLSSPLYSYMCIVVCLLVSTFSIFLWGSVHFLHCFLFSVLQVAKSLSICLILSSSRWNTLLSYSSIFFLISVIVLYNSRISILKNKLLSLYWYFLLEVTVSPCLLYFFNSAFL